MKRRFFVWVVILFVTVLVASQEGYAQIDSRNQARPDREQNSNDPDKKKRSKKDRSKRVKSKKDPRTTGKKLYSNKKQIKRNSRGRSAKAKNVERSYKGDITGRKQAKAKNRQREQRSYEQPDPYRYRRIRTEKSRAGPDAPKVRSATRKGERARTGDISGQKSVRQRSVRSAKKSVYPQRNPYVGREVRTEKSRAKSNKKQIRSVRSVTKPSEPQKPRTRSRSTSRSTSVSGIGSPKVKKKRNVYRSHERTGGEKSTNKDISGRKLRTRNTRSAVQTGGIEYSSIDPYSKGKRYNEGERYRKTAKRYSSARSISRSSESSGGRSYDRNYGQHRNRRSVRTTGVVAAKRVRSTSDPRRKGESPIYGKKYKPRGTRSVSQSGESRDPKKPRGTISVSGRTKKYRQRNTYRGKDKHFGENSSTKDIAGRRLRTRNYRSFNPTWGEFGAGPYGTGSVSGKPSKKYESAGGRRQSKAGWNNAGIPILGKSRGINSQTTSQYTGNKPLSSMPSYGPGREGSFSGKMPLSSLPSFGPRGESTYSGNMNARKLGKYRGGNESLYSGKIKSRRKLKGGGSVTGFWNNKGNPIFGRGSGPTGSSSYTGRMPMSAMPSYGPDQAGSYSGRIKAKNLSKYRGGNESVYAGRIKSGAPLQGGGSITKGWNNKGNPIIGRGAGPSGSSGYTGRVPMSAMPNYGPSLAGTYQGRMKGRKPLKGGGSITKGWNNKGNPIIGRGAGPSGSSGYTGRVPMSAMPSYGPSLAGTYQGRMKGRKPLKGGGSITKGWNNKGNPIIGRGAGPSGSSGYTGRVPMSAMPSYGPSLAGTYQGRMKGRKPLKGGGSITKRWNNKGNPIVSSGAGPKASSSFAGKMKGYKPLKGGGSITSQWNNKGKPLQKKSRNPVDLAVSSYKGDLPMSALPSYGDGGEGSYAGTMKAKKPPKGGGGSITTHWNNKGEPLPRQSSGKSDAQMGGYQGNVKQADVEIKQSPGTERGRSRTLSFLRIGNPTKAGLMHKEEHLKVKNDLPKELSRKERQRIEDSEGVDRGRTQSLSFLVLGDPTRGGLHAETGNLKRKNDLPSGIKGKNRLRLQDAKGVSNGKATTFSFWTIGEPTKGGLVSNPAQARGRLHPSSKYSKAGTSRNSIEEKDQPVKLKIWWAKLFKKNSNQPDAVKEKVRKPRYNKTEREIWETSERPDWYK